MDEQSAVLSELATRLKRIEHQMEKIHTNSAHMVLLLGGIFSVMIGWFFGQMFGVALVVSIPGALWPWLFVSLVFGLIIVFLIINLVRKAHATL